MPAMTPDEAKYIPRRRPTTPSERDLVNEALKVLVQDAMPRYGRNESLIPNAIEMEIQRQLTAEELDLVLVEIDSLTP